MNYNLIVEPNDLRSFLADAKETNNELKTELDELRIVADEIPGDWEGKDAINFFNNFDEYITNLYNITEFYDNMLKYVDEVANEYDDKDYQYYRKNMME